MRSRREFIQLASVAAMLLAAKSWSSVAAKQKLRGVNSIYHNNSIATWKVNKDGTVDNVRLG